MRPMNAPTSLLGRFHTWLAISLYVSAMLLITIVAVFAAQETSTINLHAEKPTERAIIDASA